ncbi:MAG TPA: hydrogenase maturation protease [Cyanobacteria bacterium UBA8803]|nr:hydrogenase maturation protease [Cyanobacteria bacterium UBA9273]HBL58294.1 hydrogenase maturation protease [Cyanobacteria bacterium UBA8803]
MNSTDTAISQNPVVVIGYGNSLRSDDGVGQLVATQVQGWELPSLRVLAVHQLTPELAETLESAKYAIFIDACPVSEAETDSAGGSHGVQVCPLQPMDAENFSMGHVSDPRSLLALTQVVYGHSPPAWLITIPAINFEFGENLSPLAQQGVTLALNEIRHLLAN